MSWVGVNKAAPPGEVWDWASGVLMDLSVCEEVALQVQDQSKQKDVIYGNQEAGGGYPYHDG